MTLTHGRTNSLPLRRLLFESFEPVSSPLEQCEGFGRLPEHEPWRNWAHLAEAKAEREQAAVDRVTE